VNTDMFSHTDWWPTIATLIGEQPPPREWSDNEGKPSRVGAAARPHKPTTEVSR
jgi:hypothetical protein